MYTVNEGNWYTDITSKVLLGKITGLDPELPTFQAMKCIIVHFRSDGNQERSYSDIENQGDGFNAKTFLTTCCSNNINDCCYWSTPIHNPREPSFTKHCIGTSHIELSGWLKQDLSSGDDKPYPNDLDCLWEIQADVSGGGGFPKYVAFDVKKLGLSALPEFPNKLQGIQSFDTVGCDLTRLAVNVIFVWLALFFHPGC